MSRSVIAAGITILTLVALAVFAGMGYAFPAPPAQDDRSAPPGRACAGPPGKQYHPHGGAPGQQYGGPFGGPPGQQYGGPLGGPPGQQYGGPPGNQNPPGQEYEGPPGQQYEGPPGQQYGVPNPPVQDCGPPGHQYGNEEVGPPGQQDPSG